MQKFQRGKLGITCENVNLDSAMFFNVLSEPTGKIRYILKKKSEVYKVTETTKGICLS